MKKDWPMERRRLARTVWLLLGSILTCWSIAASQGVPPSPRPGWSEIARTIQEMESRSPSQMIRSTALPDRSGYDVTRYTIRYDIDFATRTVHADVAIDAVSTKRKLTFVDLDFHGFLVTQATVQGQRARHARIRDGRVLRIYPPVPLTLKQPFTVDVQFNGAPQTNPDGLGFGFTRSGAATFAEPDGACEWFPCKDRPSDKATYEGFITVPSPMVVASNGRLAGSVTSGSRTTYYWVESHEIATYLISLAIADYRVIEDSLGSLPLRHYVYESLESAARQDFSRTPAMIDAFQTHLGVAFPFDKYGHALFENFGGAMEHQSCTSYGSRLITGDNRNDLVVAHELGHQWFGDLLTPAGWEDIWLNEGFATWTEFLWTESYDPASERAVREEAESYYMWYEGRFGRYALYAPSWNRLFGVTIYNKGGWVVAMLRYLIGDAAFFRGMNRYLSDHAYGNVRTADFEAAMEKASGTDLSAFFSQWVFGVGYPNYATSWSASPVTGGYELSVRIRQVQTGTLIFTIPLEVESTAADGRKDRRRIAVAASDVTARYVLSFQPAGVVVDPDNRALGTVEPER